MILQVMSEAHRTLRQLLDIFVEQGRTIFTPTNLDEDLVVKLKLNKVEYSIRIVAGTKVFWDDEKVYSTEVEEQAVMKNLISNILRQAFRSMTSMTSMGRGTSQKFIDVDSINKLGSMNAFKAFRASAFNCQNQILVNLDIVNRFVQTKPALDYINQLWDDLSQKHSRDEDVEDAINEEFRGRSVVTTYGAKRSYVVKRVEFQYTPSTLFFQTQEGAQQSVADYFRIHYKINLKQKD